ncbi:HAD family hydrolase [Streptacidiphilus griseoplanus]|uniref:HAD family hydrolase n=1 Tax=Peterkaempfera griseoplana TaxID=66896 RepID=UPI0006E28A41|nr:HAD family hydrolase [Peterkaempfera griseoplana]
MSSPRTPYRLIATDLDGTLLTGSETVSPRTLAALAAATAAGAVHIVVTGRPAAVTRSVLDAIGYHGLAVCGQGAQVYDAGSHRLITSVTLDRRLAALAVAKIEAEVGPLAVAAHRDGADGRMVAGPAFELTIAALPMTRLDDHSELWSEPVGKLYIQHPALGDDELAAAARAVVGDLVGVVMAGEGIVELLPLGLNKATGLRIAARRLGVTAAETIAFGDMPNDIPMFAWAAHGVAMANAHAELKAVADELTASNDQDGVALVLERLFPSPTA